MIKFQDSIVNAHYYTEGMHHVIKTKRGPRSFFQVVRFSPRTSSRRHSQGNDFVHRMMEGDVISYCTAKIRCWNLKEVVLDRTLENMFWKRRQTRRKTDYAMDGKG